MTELWPGVMRCIAPAHAIGAVRLCLTLGDGRPCSKAITFEYKCGSASRSCNASRYSISLYMSIRRDCMTESKHARPLPLSTNLETPQGLAMPADIASASGVLAAAVCMRQGCGIARA